MPVYFVLFLAMLGAAVVFYASALGASTLSRRPLPTLIGGRAADGLQTLHLGLAWINFGVSWLLYFNVYRIHVDMAALSDIAFLTFARGYTTRLPVVVLPYGAGALAAALALWSAPTGVSRRALWGVATLWLLSVACTPWAAGAQDDMHDHGFSDAAFEQLQLAHLARSLCISAAAGWSMWQCRRLRA
ncbi:hypothetical protein [Roseateles noduli]|uniref:hypothetical protein n=1 Tax=Roseateles noduli TaxID=2052484 RepID=UPI003D661599